MRDTQPTRQQYKTLLAQLVQVLQDAQRPPEDRIAWCLGWIDSVGCWPDELLCPTCWALGVPCDRCDIPENAQQVHEWGEAVMRGEADLLNVEEYFPELFAEDDED